MMPPAGHDEGGFTLAELLVAFAALGLVLAAVAMIQQSITQSYVAGSNKSEVQQNARVALDRIAREIREATINPGTGAPGLTAAAASSVSFYDQNTGLTTYALVGNTLTRTANAVNEVIIGSVQALTFAYRDANGNVLGVPVGAPGTVARVDITVQTGSEDTVAAGGFEDTRAELTTSVRLRNL